jgi:hypothetical protein
VKVSTGFLLFIFSNRRREPFRILNFQEHFYFVVYYSTFAVLLSFVGYLGAVQTVESCPQKQKVN